MKMRKNKMGRPIIVLSLFLFLVIEGANSADNNIKTDFDSQCTETDRGYQVSEPPKVIFFSSVDHNEQTFGCTPKTVISLGLDDKGSDIQGDPKDWQQDTATMQKLLIDSGKYDNSAPSYILVHGFLSSWNGDTWMCKFKDSILNGTRANVFIVDWSGGSKPMLPVDYGAAVSNTQYVGQLLAKFLQNLLRMTGQKDASQFHMIGHSLGAHISGFVGYALGDMSLGRITGLDPAGPCFSSDTDQRNSTELSSTGELSRGRKRLSTQCAKLVVAIHTDTAKFGLDGNCGHYDIYVNGGSSQPTCIGQSLQDRKKNLLNLRLLDAINVGDVACAHGYSHMLTAALMPMMLQANVQPNGKQQQQQQQNEFSSADKKCYLMAHRCASWKAFKRGECGLTTVGEDASSVIDALAVDPQMDTRLQAQAADKERSLMRLDEVDSGPKSGQDDEKVNGEEDGANQSSNIAENTESRTRCWQHFIRTSPSQSSICAFTYQIVIAAESSNELADKLYVEIPLDKEPALFDAESGGKVLNRTVQVSHKVARDSYAQAQLSRVFKSLRNVDSQLDFYTALITFDSASIEECRDLLSSPAAKTNRKRWYLCQAISDVDRARLSSASQKTLGRVKWVAMAYLSGPSASIRDENSFLFEPDLGNTVESKPQEVTAKPKGRMRSFGRRLLSGIKRGVKKVARRSSRAKPEASNLTYSVPLKLVAIE